MNPASSADQAAEWAARLDAGPLQRDEAEALALWLDADPDNESRLDEMQRLHQKIRRVVPGMVAAGKLEVPKKASSPHLGWAWAGGLVAIFALALVWFFQQRPETFSTSVAQRQVVMLPDGTRAELNALTHLRVRLRGNERHVWLDKGEALFTVAKDRSRPFVVETTAGSVRVTGTVFNVSSQTADSLAVVLLEGSVEATPLNDSHVRKLAPGDALSVSGNRNVLRQLSAAELADAVAWREGKIVFHDTPLAEALERFARYHGRVIEVEPAAHDLALGGRFGLDDFDVFLKDLAVALPVTIRREQDGRIRVERIPPEEK